MTLLEIDNLHTQFHTPDGIVRAVDGVSFTVDRGEIVGIVGESGCGKSVAARSIVGLEKPGEIAGGSIRFDGQDLTEASDRTLRRFRATDVSMVFQDPDTTLNPVFDVGEQIAESIRVHDEPHSQTLLDYLHAPLFSRRSDWKNARNRAVELMDEVGIASPEDRVDAHPHELSGGMRQRAMLAIALAGDPDLLIADEPTTALDTTTQAQILERLRESSVEREMATLLITHDLGVVAELCDRVVVMYAGEVMETGRTERILTEPRHPYTRALLNCLTQQSAPQTRLPAIEGDVPSLLEKPTGCPFAPRCDRATEDCRNESISAVDLEDGRVACIESVVDEPRDLLDGQGGRDVTAQTGREHSEREPLVRLEGVTKWFSLENSMLDRFVGEPDRIHAVSDVDLTVETGETVGLVGESGSGKSTIASLITGLHAPTAGEIRFDGTPVGPVSDRPSELLTDIGVVFQNPRSSINPRLTVREAVAEPLRTHGWEGGDRTERVDELLSLVGLPARHTSSYPHELSGGQVQRVAIARAIALDPRLVVLDEPVSALDASVQARVLNLLGELQRKLELTYLFISHDLDVVGHLADRVAVLYLGELMEVGPASQVFDQPSHPYTEALLEAVPSIEASDRGSVSLEGDVPSPIDPPSGCAFHPRCPMAEPDCETDQPGVTRVGEAESRCHFAEDVADREGNTDAGDERIDARPSNAGPLERHW